MSTPLEDFLAARKVEIAELAKGTDGRAAMARLMQRIDTVNVTDWMDEELTRGSSTDLIHEAFANYIANLLAPVCFPQMQAGFHVALANAICCAALERLEDMGTPGGSVGAVIVSRIDGRQLDVMTEGIAKKGTPR